MGNLRMNMVMAAVLCLLAFTGGSCQADSASRIDFYQKVADAANQRVIDAEGQIKSLQLDLAAAKAAFDNPALPAEQRQAVQSTIDTLSKTLGQAEQLRQIAAAAAADANVAIVNAKANPSTGAELDILTSLVQSVTSRLGPTAAAWGTIATIVLSIVAAALKGRQAKQATAQLVATQDDLAAHQQTLSAIVKGVEAAPATEAGVVKTSIRDVMTDKGVLNSSNEIIDQIKAA